jgi:hypothetical protein
VGALCSSSTPPRKYSAWFACCASLKYVAICREELIAKRREILAGPAAAMGLGMMRTAGTGVQATNVEAFVEADLRGTTHESPEMKHKVPIHVWWLHLNLHAGIGWCCCTVFHLLRVTENMFCSQFVAHALTLSSREGVADSILKPWHCT